MYVNPNFLNSTSSARPIKTINKVEHSVQAHINPNFLNRSRNVSEPDSNGAAEWTNNGRIHINPNFVGRSLPLPPTSSTSFSGLPMLNQVCTKEKNTPKEDLTQSTRPHINPKFVDTLKAKAYDDAVKKAVMNNEYALKNHTTEQAKKVEVSVNNTTSTTVASNSIHVNPKFKPQVDTSAIQSNTKKDMLGTSKAECYTSFQVQSRHDKVESSKARPLNLKGKENHMDPPPRISNDKTKLTEKLTPDVLRSATKSSTPLNKKSLFKKIGTRKLVRMSGASPPSSKKISRKTETAPSSSRMTKAPLSVQTPVSSIHFQSKIYDTSSGGAFKKIGQRKLIRKSPSTKQLSSPSKGKSQSLFNSQKKIWSAQVYRVKSSNKIIKESSTPVNAFKKDSKRYLFSTPMARKVKKQINSPCIRKSISNSARKSTKTIKSPISIFNRRRKTPFSLVRNPFRIDRRKGNLKRRLSMTSVSSQHTQAANAPVKRFKVNNKSPNKQITAVSLESPVPNTSKIEVDTVHAKPIATANKQCMPAPQKPARKGFIPALSSSKVYSGPNMNSESQQGTLIQVHGVRYSVSENGRKLKRLPPKVTVKETNEGENCDAGLVKGEKIISEPNSNTTKQTDDCKIGNTTQNTKKKFYLEGEEYIEDEPGILIRSRNSMTRASITNYKTRSIHTILKSQTRAKQYCMFYNKFGKCNKKDKGVCPYIHDPEKVAVCRKFLHGNCFKEACLLSHKIAPEKMPSCKFFLEGLCTKGETCPYRHVKVSENAEICKDYQKGYCPNGNDCKKKHENLSKSKPDLMNKSLLKHESTEISKSTKKIPPAKPKRKSLGPVIAPKDISHEPIKSAIRYFEGGESANQGEHEGKPSTSNSSLNDPHARAMMNGEMNIGNLPNEAESTQQILFERKEAIVNDNMSKNMPYLKPIQSPNDSGPYEEIDEEFLELRENVHSDNAEHKIRANYRPTIGRLPSYISLNGLSEDIQDKCEKELKTEKLHDTKPIEVYDTSEDITLHPEEYEERLI